MSGNIIVVTKEDLHFGGMGLDLGIYERVRIRIKDRNRILSQEGLPNLTNRQERNILIGEVGEVAVRKSLIERGMTITSDSWTEFTQNKGYETVVDIAAHDGTRITNYQVKSSESGNRRISEGVLAKCMTSTLHYITFVAVRQVVDIDGSMPFECQITSQMAPRHIPRLASWEKKSPIYVHRENPSFMKEWAAAPKYRSKVHSGR